MNQHGVGWSLNDLGAGEPTPGLNGRTTPGIFVDQGQQPQIASIVSDVMDEVLGPYVIGVCTPRPEAGTVVEPESATRPMFLRHIKPLAALDVLYPVLADATAPMLQRGRAPAVAVAPVLQRQGRSRPRQSI